MKLIWFGLGIAAKTWATNYAKRRLQEEGLLEKDQCCPCTGESMMRGLAWLGQGDSYKTTEPTPTPTPAPRPVIVGPTPTPTPIPIRAAPAALPGTGPSVRVLPDGTVITGQFAVSPFVATPQETQRIQSEISATQAEQLKLQQDIRLKEAHKSALEARRAAIEQESQKRKLWLMRDAAALQQLISQTPPGARRKALEAQYQRDYGAGSKTEAALRQLEQFAKEATRNLAVEIGKTDAMLGEMQRKGAQFAERLKTLTGGEAGSFPVAPFELGERAVAMELE